MIFYGYVHTFLIIFDFIVFYTLYKEICRYRSHSISENMWSKIYIVFLLLWLTLVVPSPSRILTKPDWSLKDGWLKGMLKSFWSFSCGKLFDCGQHTMGSLRTNMHSWGVEPGVVSTSGHLLIEVHTPWEPSLRKRHDSPSGKKITVLMWWAFLKIPSPIMEVWNFW